MWIVPQARIISIFASSLCFTGLTPSSCSEVLSSLMLWWRIYWWRHYQHQRSRACVVCSSWRVCAPTARTITGKVLTHLKGCFGGNATDGRKRDGHYVVPDGSHVKRDVLKFEMPLHIHVVVLTYKVNAKYIYLYFYLYCNKCKSNNSNNQKVRRHVLDVLKLPVCELIKYRTSRCSSRFPEKVRWDVDEASSQPIKPKLNRSTSDYAGYFMY